MPIPEPPTYVLTLGSKNGLAVISKECFSKTKTYLECLNYSINNFSKTYKLYSSTLSLILENWGQKSCDTSEMAHLKYLLRTYPWVLAPNPVHFPLCHSGHYIINVDSSEAQWNKNPHPLLQSLLLEISSWLIHMFCI